MRRNRVKFFLIAAILIIAASIYILSRQNADISTIKVVERLTSEELAEKLIKEVYDGVEFTKSEGNGEDFILRYYCSNICIDACKGGAVRYLCDVTAKSETDLFSNWLIYDENAKTIEQTEENGIVCKKIEGDNIFATLYVNPENERVFAATIYLKYREY